MRRAAGFALFVALAARGDAPSPQAVMAPEESVSIDAQLAAASGSGPVTGEAHSARFADRRNTGSTTTPAAPTAQSYDPCAATSKHKPLLEQDYPTEVWASLRYHARPAYGALFPQLQPLGQPATATPSVWGNLDEYRITVRESIVLAEGWHSLEQFLGSWPSDLDGVARGEGALEFGSLMYFDRTPMGRGPGDIIVSDLPTMAGPHVELADYVITSTDAASFRMATLTVLGKDGVINRALLFGFRLDIKFTMCGLAGHPFCGVREFGFERGASGSDEVTFFTRGVYSADEPGIQSQGVGIASAAWHAFIAGLGERFGMSPVAARFAVRGVGGSQDFTFTTIPTKPACFKMPAFK